MRHNRDIAKDTDVVMWIPSQMSLIVLDRNDEKG